MRSRESGFTLIEIMIVMAIIVTLAGAVVITVPLVQNWSKRTNCARNLQQLGTVLNTDSVTGHFPNKSGAGFLLSLYMDHQEVRQDVKVFVCPGDDELPSVVEPGSDQHRAMFSELTEKKLLDGEWNDYISSYAGRNVRDYPIRKSSDTLQPVACDRNGLNQDRPHHPDGVNILYSNGKVDFVKKKGLNLNPDDEIYIGESGPEMLVPLAFKVY